MSKQKLKRELGLFYLTFSGIGIILGAGIYVLIGKAASVAGSSLWLSFLIAAGIAICTAMCYAELSSTFQKAGAEYVYVKKAFGKESFGDVLAFIVGWILVVGGVIAATTVSLGFGGYLESLVGIPQIIGAIISIVVVSIILYYGVKESATAAIIGTFVEMSGLLLVIYIGLPYIGNVDLSIHTDQIFNTFKAAALIFFAYIGFEEMARMAEETKDPQKTMPRAILLAFGITSIIYILVAISSMGVLGVDKLSESSAPLAEVAKRVLGESTHFLISIIALFATFNTVLMIQFAASRLIYGMADNPKLKIFSKVDKKRRTPIIAIIFVSVFAMLFLILEKIETVAYLTDFAIFLAFVIVNLSLIQIRRRYPDIKSGFKVPSIAIPVIGALSSFLIIFTIPIDVIIYGIILIILGFPIYGWVNSK